MTNGGVGSIGINLEPSNGTMHDRSEWRKIFLRIYLDAMLDYRLIKIWRSTHAIHIVAVVSKIK